MIIKCYFYDFIFIFICKLIRKQFKCIQISITFRDTINNARYFYIYIQVYIEFYIYRRIYIFYIYLKCIQIIGLCRCLLYLYTNLYTQSITETFYFTAR